MDGARVWLPVERDAHVPAFEVRRTTDTVTLARWRTGGTAPEEVDVSMKRLAELPRVTGDPSVTADDLVSLPDISLPAVLHNLRLRFAADAIYTAIGPVLISVNPHKRMGDLDGFIKYMAYLDEKEEEELPPHIYRLARAAYTALVRTGASQSILVSGESGAGKTEACKLVVACLTTLAPAGVAGATEAALHGAQMLEAWGNATTTQNRNSSRFGKWLSVHFDATSGAISQCSLSPYLLEKSRVVVHSNGERSYHVFYQMVAGVRGAERRDRLGLGPADGTCLYSRFAYLTPQGTAAEGCGVALAPSASWASAGVPPPPPALGLGVEGSVEGVSTLEEDVSVSREEDAAEWRETMLKLSGIGLAPSLTESVTSSLAAVLALGNVAFHAPAPSAGYWGSPPQSPNRAEEGSSALRVLHF